MPLSMLGRPLVSVSGPKFKSVVLAAIAGISLLVTAVPAAMAPEARRDLRELQSRFIRVTGVHFSTVTRSRSQSPEAPGREVRPLIFLTLSNRSERAIWLV